MKKLLLTLMLSAVCFMAKAINYEDARREAWFLTDKMAYELNLTSEQYDRAYQINLDYLLSLNTAADCYGYYWTYRDTDLRCILSSWQYALYSTLDYFYRPVRWLRSAWYYPICAHYRRGYYYFDRPTLYVSYHGGMWHRRGHNDPSPYRHYAYRPAPGLRDHYHSHHGKPAYRPEPGRPGHGRPGNGRPGHGRYVGNEKPNRPTPSRPDNNSAAPSRPGNNSAAPSRPGNNTSNSGRGVTSPENNRRINIERQSSLRPSQTRPSQNRTTSREVTPSRTGGGTYTSPGRSNSSASRPSRSFDNSSSSRSNSGKVSSSSRSTSRSSSSRQFGNGR
ncbi:MAG: hypothetical protein KIG47_01390 [Prevotellamassilia sp.]|nr:hypothetical protein [Prevotellamassilia sp.]